jgi:hypothetical protein
MIYASKKKNGLNVIATCVLALRKKKLAEKLYVLAESWYVRALGYKHEQFIKREL